MPYLVLLNDLLLATAALIQHHNQVETAVVFKHHGGRAHFELGHHRCHQRRKLAFGTPAHITALKGVAGV